MQYPCAQAFAPARQDEGIFGAIFIDDMLKGQITDLRDIDTARASSGWRMRILLARRPAGCCAEEAALDNAFSAGSPQPTDR